MTAEANSSLQSEADHPKTALVLAGGGSLGSVQVGMLRALAARGVRPDLIVGSSVGALNAAHYAGMPTADGVEKLAGIWRSLRRQDVFPITLRGLIGFVSGRTICWLFGYGLTGRRLSRSVRPVTVSASP